MSSASAIIDQLKKSAVPAAENFSESSAAEKNSHSGSAGENFNSAGQIQNSGEKFESPPFEPVPCGAGDPFSPAGICGCPTFWLDPYGNWRCAECQPAPSRAMVRRVAHVVVLPFGGREWAGPPDSPGECCWCGLRHDGGPEHCAAAEAAAFVRNGSLTYSEREDACRRLADDRYQQLKRDFDSRRDVWNRSVDDLLLGLEEKVRQFVSDPIGAMAAFGRETGKCQFCMNPLSDERSTAVGYGRICARNWGLPWGDEESDAASGFQETSKETVCLKLIEMFDRAEGRGMIDAGMRFTYKPFHTVSVTRSRDSDGVMFFIRNKTFPGEMFAAAKLSEDDSLSFFSPVFPEDPPRVPRWENYIRIVDMRHQESQGIACDGVSGFRTVDSGQHLDDWWDSLVARYRSTEERRYPPGTCDRCGCPDFSRIQARDGEWVRLDCAKCGRTWKHEDA